MDKPVTEERLWVRLSPKNKDMAEAGLTFAHKSETVEALGTPEVKEALRRGRLQFIGKSKAPRGVAA